MNITKIAVAAMLFAAGAAASAKDYVFQWDYTSPLTLHGITFEDGTVIQDVNVGSQYTGSYGMWNSQTITSDFSVGFNIEDSLGNLIHTYAISGTTGSNDFAVPFLSSEVGPLAALVGGTTVVATGGFQTVYSFNTANDHYTLQFRTDLGGATVPEPASWALMIVGFGLVGGLMRRRSRTAIAA